MMLIFMLPVSRIDVFFEVFTKCRVAKLVRLLGEVGLLEVPRLKRL